MAEKCGWKTDRTNDGKQKLEEVPMLLEQFIVMHGGGYFFSPSKSALGKLAAGTLVAVAAIRD